MQLNRFLIRPLVESGLREELGSGDTTGGFLVLDEDPIQTGQIYAKDTGVVCGLLLADETIRQLDEHAEIEHLVSDGEVIGPGTTLLKISFLSLYSAKSVFIILLLASIASTFSFISSRPLSRSYLTYSL